MKALVTGAAGALGRLLVSALDCEVIATDLRDMDVTSPMLTQAVISEHEPDVIFHLAGAKLAVDGELYPEKFASVNITGTINIVRAAGAAKVVFASTCKAADPETAYGASKLIAERVVLNAGGVVVRFFNIRECGPSVFTIWETLPETAPVPYTDCWRYFISADQAIGMLKQAVDLPSGRYAPDPGGPQHMRWVAVAEYPGRDLVEVPRRRGDRAREPLCAACEVVDRRDGYLVVRGAHDPQNANQRLEPVAA